MSKKIVSEMRTYRYTDTPLGKLLLVAENEVLTGLYFVGGKHQFALTEEDILDEHAPVFSHTITQLEEYFNGMRTEFDIPMHFHGTPFQISVWQNLMNVAYGETATYLDIANNLHNPNAVRAVGLANGKNPISLIVPCHRIIGSNGSLVGYAGGVANKAWLLQHEQKHAQSSRQEYLFADSDNRLL